MPTENTIAETNGHAATSSLLAALYEPVAEEMQQVEATLRDELRSEYDAVDEMLRHGTMLGGKRLRPALLLLSARLFGTPTSDHVTLAAVMEMIHTATLIHDDILDEADQRRHVATCNAIWDNQAAVLLGDYLFTHAFYLASTTGSTTACRIIGAATNSVCEGELRQVRSRGNFELSEDEYYQIIEAKTAVLCECSCRLGAQFAESDRADVRRLGDYGKHLGIAFQVTDDLLDVLGDSRATGKSLGTDIEKQKMTLPLIRLLQTVEARERVEIVEILSGSREATSGAGVDLRERLLPYLESSDALQYARDAAAHHAALAEQQLVELPAGPARDILAGLPAFVLARSA